ncbi:unnamed protein product [Linum trigynum]
MIGSWGSNAHRLVEKSRRLEIEVESPYAERKSKIGERLNQSNMAAEAIWRVKEKKMLVHQEDEEDQVVVVERRVIRV